MSSFSVKTIDLEVVPHVPYEIVIRSKFDTTIIAWVQFLIKLPNLAINGPDNMVLDFIHDQASEEAMQVDKMGVLVSRNSFTMRPIVFVTPLAIRPLKPADLPRQVIIEALENIRSIPKIINDRD